MPDNVFTPPDVFDSTRFHGFDLDDPRHIRLGGRRLIGPTSGPPVSADEGGSQAHE
jgi:hypothetical protein